MFTLLLQAVLISLKFCFHLYISSNIPISLRDLIIFSTSQFFNCSVLMFPLMLYFFLLSLHWGNLIGDILLLVSGIHILHFPHVGCWWFLDIKCLWVSLMCPVCILLSLTSYCLQLLWTLSHSSMHGLI